jgi:hypothetical protein
MLVNLHSRPWQHDRHAVRARQPVPQSGCAKADAATQFPSLHAIESFKHHFATVVCGARSFVG